MKKCCVILFAGILLGLVCSPAWAADVVRMRFGHVAPPMHAQAKAADWFAEYVGVVTDHLSDRVTYWMTLNEPQCFIELGHRQSKHAPGIKLHQKEVLLAGHHALISHGKAVQAIRARAKTRSPRVPVLKALGRSEPAIISPEGPEAPLTGKRSILPRPISKSNSPARGRF